MLSAKSFARLARPEYFLRPAQVARRLWRETYSETSESATVRLPWGLDIHVDPREAIGRALVSQGLYEPLVTEALWRLTSPGDLAVDAGANIGYMTCIFASRTGASGKVYCFEPHPDVFRQLQENVLNWQSRKKCGAIQLFAAGLGERDALGELCVPDDFSANRGTSSVDSNSSGNSGALRVRILCLDRMIESPLVIAVMKIDVEGNELAVLAGMQRNLQQRRVRNIIFEEFGAFPAPAHRFLQTHGYSIFGLEKRLRGIRLVANGAPDSRSTELSAPNYLATSEPELASRRLQSGMWESFGPARLFDWG
ncbi:MAG TPA: FkbM family methyltransferase [Candidatus Acidoferrum sp.]